MKGVIQNERILVHLLRMANEIMTAPAKENRFINQPPWDWLHNRRNSQNNFKIILAIPVSVDTFDKYARHFS